MSIEENLRVLEEKRKKSSALKIIFKLFDENSFLEMDKYTKSDNEYVGIITGFGQINGLPVYAFAQDTELYSGAMTKTQAEKVCRLYEMAESVGAPVIGIYNSLGGNLQEQNTVLKAFGKVISKINRLSGVVPQVSLISGTCLGINALMASEADIVVMSNNAEFGINTSGEGSSADVAEKTGICHIRCNSISECIIRVRSIINMLPSNNLDDSPQMSFDYNSNLKKKFDKISVGITQKREENYSPEMIEAFTDQGSFVEFQKSFGLHCKIGLARLYGNTIGVLSCCGIIDEEACTKATRFVRFCDAFSIPVVTFINSEGFTDLRGTAKLSCAFEEATTAKVSIIYGTAYGTAYITLAGVSSNVDFVFAWPCASIGAINPTTAAVFLKSKELQNSENPMVDRKKIIEEYEKNEYSPFNAAELGLVHDVIRPEATRESVNKILNILKYKKVSALPKKHSNIQF